MTGRRIVPIVATLLLAPAAALAQTDDPAGLRFSAVAVDLGGMWTSEVTVARVEITIDRWSDPAEADRLMQALGGEGGKRPMPLAVLRELKPVGRISVNSNVGWNLHFAVRRMDCENEHITLAADRPTSFEEAFNQPQLALYPFVFIELDINAEGRGKGTLSPAARLIPSFDELTVFVEGYDAQPIELRAVKREER